MCCCVVSSHRREKQKSTATAADELRLWAPSCRTDGARGVSVSVSEGSPEAVGAGNELALSHRCVSCHAEALGGESTLVVLFRYSMGCVCLVHADDRWLESFPSSADTRRQHPQPRSPPAPPQP